jgi:beta-galactosidase
MCSSPEAPNLHVATITTTAGETRTVTFGVKVLTHSAAWLVLNGAPLELRGGCCHHDNGPLGAMAEPRSAASSCSSESATTPSTRATTHRAISS